MGKIILNIPKNVKLEYKIKDIKEAEKLIRKFERLKSVDSLKSNKEIKDESIVGIWKDRFPLNKSSVEIANEFRKKAWTRY